MRKIIKDCRCDVATFPSPGVIFFNIAVINVNFKMAVIAAKLKIAVIVKLAGVVLLKLLNESGWHTVPWLLHFPTPQTSSLPRFEVHHMFKERNNLELPLC